MFVTEAGWIGRQAILMTGINSVIYVLSTLPTCVTSSPFTLNTNAYKLCVCPVGGMLWIVGEDVQYYSQEPLWYETAIFHQFNADFEEDECIFGCDGLVDVCRCSTYSERCCCLCHPLQCLLRI